MANSEAKKILSKAIRDIEEEVYNTDILLQTFKKGMDTDNYNRYKFYKNKYKQTQDDLNNLKETLDDLKDTYSCL